MLNVFFGESCKITEIIHGLNSAVAYNISTMFDFVTPINIQLCLLFSNNELQLTILYEILLEIEL